MKEFISFLFGVAAGAILYRLFAYKIIALGKEYEAKLKARL